jgi:hypothetical protein
VWRGGSSLDRSAQAAGRPLKRMCSHCVRSLPVKIISTFGTKWLIPGTNETYL